jgi:hypothetical protein
MNPIQRLSTAGALLVTRAILRFPEPRGIRMCGRDCPNLSAVYRFELVRSHM